LQLNVYISSAADGLFTIKAVQMPELVAHARTIEDIPLAARSAAAAIAGHAPGDFDIIMEF
jgi:predicted RNase H-like HicB family nuclease